jgi:hypothetical protein
LVDLLLVAESPPSALDRYFYFEDRLDVDQEDAVVAQVDHPDQGDGLRRRVHRSLRRRPAGCG